MFKSQLQEFAQKAGWTAPVYNITKEGPSHEPKFKAIVTIQNEVYESPSFYGNLKKAEHAAAEVALMAVCAKSGVEAALPHPLHESGLCKNLLQEYAQKCKLPIPVYTLARLGETHSPMFTATVEIAGVQYKGGVCKSKKEAEIKAAKTALIAICSDLGGSTKQAFENQLSSVGQTEVSPAAVRMTPRHAIKRKKKQRRFVRGGFKRGRKAQQANDGNDGGQGQESTNQDDGGQQGDGQQADGQQADAAVQENIGAPELINVNTEIPGITVAN